MANGAIAPESVVALPGAAAAAVAWRARGQLHVTVIAKASFAFAPDAEMPRIEPQEIVRGEVHHGNHPLKSVRFTTDLVPFLPQADVVFTGHAHAPPASPVSSLPVRLTIFDGERVVLDKALVVQDSAPFQRMPIVYERALAGADAQENPLGMGGIADPGEPNVVDPALPGRPAGFGPIARAWPARKRLLGGAGRVQLDAPILEIPEPFDWSYFQSAPRDQRVGYLRGGEWIVLQGLHAAAPLLRTRLPAARGLARVYGLSDYGVAEGQPLVLEADTLRIDGDEQRCIVSFRRSFPVPSEAALARVRLVAGVELPGVPLDWPARFEDLESGAPGAPPAQDTASAESARGGPAHGGPSRVGPAHGGSSSGGSSRDGRAHGEAELAKLRAAAAGATAILVEDAGAAASAHPFRPAPAPSGIARSAGPPAPRQGSGTLELGAGPAVPVAGPAEAPRRPAAYTLEIGPTRGASRSGSSTLPFVPGPPAAPDAPARPVAGVAAGAGAAERRASPERVSSGTLALPPDAVDRALHEGELPFSPPAAERRALHEGEPPPSPPAAEHRALEGGAATPELAPPARTPSAPPGAAGSALGATLLDEPPGAASDAGAMPRAAPASSPLPAPPAPAPSPPRQPPAPVSLPAPSPQLKRSLYDRFDRKRST